MCGINGVLYKESLADPSKLRELLNLMNDEIIHRGPDDDGVYTDASSASYSVGMAMRRLSIIDLSTGKQPIFSDDNQLVIVFNGEIYNYRILKADLLKDGVTFKTASDTEVILKLYEKHGTAAFSMLEGMFAFSIHDKRLNKLFIARDFFGEKPLYYTLIENKFYWASELKSIIKVLPSKPGISKQALNLFFQLTYIPSPYSIYENIFKLSANHYMEFDCEHFTYQVNEIPQTFNQYSHSISKQEAKTLTHDLVQKSVESCSISDVPLGTFLSGGVDSSIISLCLAAQSDKKIDTFSMGFDKRSFDETDKSKTVAKIVGSNHHEFIVKADSLKDNIDDILLNFDEPFADSSALPTFLVAQNTRTKVKVALTGDGGDEIFGGYNKYYMGRLNNIYTKYIGQKTHNIFLGSLSNLLSLKNDTRGFKLQINKLVRSVNYEGDFYYNIISLGFIPDERAKLFRAGYLIADPLTEYKAKSDSKNLNDFRNIDRLISLEGDMLVKVDRTSMLTSLECRAPFLNKELWNFTNQLPESFLIKGWDKKHILKEAFKKYFPKGFLDIKKKGFGVPVGDWLRGPLKNELLSYSNKQFLEKQGIFEPEWVTSLIANHLEAKVDSTFRVWTFYCFQKWYTNIYELDPK